TETVLRAPLPAPHRPPCGPARSFPLRGRSRDRAHVTRVLHRKRRTTAAGPFHVRVVEVEARLHESVVVVELGPVQVEEAFAVDDDLRVGVAEHLVTGAFRVEVHLVLQPGTAATDDFDTQAGALFVALRPRAAD